MLKKESCIYAGSGVSQTPITISLKGEMILKEIIFIVLFVVAVAMIVFGIYRMGKRRMNDGKGNMSNELQA